MPKPGGHSKTSALLGLGRVGQSNPVPMLYDLKVVPGVLDNISGLTQPWPPSPTPALPCR